MKPDESEFISNMKLIQIIAIALGFFFFEGCISAGHVNGTYTNVYAGIAGSELRFSRESGKFEYYARTERMVRNYSAGTWMQHKKTIFLNGFDDNNTNVLNVESKVEDAPNENKDKIEVQYRDEPLDTFIKVDVIVNEGPGIRIPGDTTYFTEAAVRTLQIKSYFSHEGILLGNPAHIDTLYSPRIEVANADKHRKILLKLNVDFSDFYRVTLKDTLTVKNRRTLVWGKGTFKKLRPSRK